MLVGSSIWSRKYESRKSEAPFHTVGNFDKNWQIFILKIEFCSFFPQNIREFVTKYSFYNFFHKMEKNHPTEKSWAQISGGKVCDLWSLGPRDAFMI
jgi:hypothetical protein